MAIVPEAVLSAGEQPQTGKVRSLLCYWANREIAMTTVEIARQLSMCQSAVSRASLRGEQIAKENKFDLVETIA